MSLVHTYERRENWLPLAPEPALFQLRREVWPSSPLQEVVYHGG
jgi:hypothetical protein